MDQAQVIIRDIVARCGYQNVEISETLAAFAARMVIHKSNQKLALDKQLSEDDITFLIEHSVTALLKQRDPVLETVKMQLEFDYQYAHFEDLLKQKRKRKEHEIAVLQRHITALVPQKASDFETLTTLYRQIFTLLMLDANLNETSSTDRNVEKEVAAALESVFPRIGLKTFVSLSLEDKKFQLNELMRVVEGIRLFNKELGKGGAGITISIETIQSARQSLSDRVKNEVRDASDACEQYTDVLLHFYQHRLKETSEASLLPMIQRWQEELGNRRQFLSYLQSLEEDISFSSEKIMTTIETFKTEMNSLKNLVGSRTSLPKSHVYPLFESVSRSWNDILQEHEILETRSASVSCLLAFKDSFDRTLNERSEFLRQARREGSIPADELFQDVESFSADDRYSQLNGAKSHGALSLRIKSVFSSELGSEMQTEGISEDGLIESDRFSVDDDDSSLPVRMSIDSTPEFMQLPLEYQGFCPWTIVERGGLLLLGNPSLGVVHYRNAYHVFVNERALGEFMINPKRYIHGVVKVAGKQPALIYLLRLQDSFPNTSLSDLLKLCQSVGKPSHRGGSLIHPLLAPPPRQKVDASTGTPTHFVEKHLDYDYDWNEWNLRRKAIKIANLRNCKTVSCQTILSQFRREVDTQVYARQDTAIQTLKDKGTNPPIVTTYLSGLRSGNVNTGRSKSKIEEKESYDNEETKVGGNQQPTRIVSLTLEL